MMHIITATACKVSISYGSCLQTVIFHLTPVILSGLPFCNMHLLAAFAALVFSYVATLRQSRALPGDPEFLGPFYTCSFKKQMTIEIDANNGNKSGMIVENIDSWPMPDFFFIYNR